MPLPSVPVLKMSLQQRGVRVESKRTIEESSANMDEYNFLPGVKQTDASLETVALLADRRVVSSLERMTDGFVAVDREWRYTYINHQTELYLGIQRDDLLDKCIWEVYPEAIGTRFYQYCQEAMATGEPGTFEAFYPPSQRWYALHLYPSSDGLAIFYNDITEQKYAEQQMRFKASIVQSLWDALIVTDLQYTILDWNAAAEALYGWKKEEVLGKDVRSVVSTVFPEDLREEWVQQLRSRGYWQGELLQKRKDGTTAPILAAVSLVKDLEGNTIGIVAVNRDITERRELEQRKDDFIDIASHELKTPLTAIKGMAQLLRKKLAREGRDDLLAFLSLMEQQIKSMTRLTAELLDVARMQAGQVDYAQVLVDVDALVYEVVEMVQQPTSSHTLCLHGASRKSVVGDPERLKQVLINLISNAIKYSPDADRVDIALSADDSRVVIAVQDDGVGIPQEDQDKIFDRFYRAHSSDERTVSGFGIGLYIVREIIIQHRGTITVESEEGKGSTFYIMLPFKRNDNWP